MDDIKEQVAKALTSIISLYDFVDNQLDEDNFTHLVKVTNDSKNLSEKQINELLKEIDEVIHNITHVKESISSRALLPLEEVLIILLKMKTHVVKREPSGRKVKENESGVFSANSDVVKSQTGVPVVQPADRAKEGD